MEWNGTRIRPIACVSPNFCAVPRCVMYLGSEHFHLGEQSGVVLVLLEAVLGGYSEAMLSKPQRLNALG